MAIGPTFEKGEVDEVDLQHAYDKARSIGLALAERYAREALKANPEYREFFMAMGAWGFIKGGNPDDGYWLEVSEPLLNLMDEWDAYLKLSGESMRFTADGPVRWEW